MSPAPASTDVPRKFGPHAWLFLASLAGIAVGLWLALWLPNPFADLQVGDRPSRLIMFFRVAGGVLAFFALLRIIGWKTLVVDAQGLESRGLFGGARRHLWRDLKSAVLDQPEGTPKAYRLRFETGVVELIAMHWKKSDVDALRAFARKSGATASGSA